MRTRGNSGGGGGSISSASLTGVKQSNSVLKFDISSINPDGSKVLFEDIFPVIQATRTWSANNYSELIMTFSWTQSADGKTITLTLGGNAPSLIYATMGWGVTFYYR